MPSSGGGRARGAGAFGGRLDHTLANLNTLHRHAGPPLALAGEGNLTRLLPAGRSELAVDRGLLGPACGLVALGAPATATSSGLRWNLGAAHRAGPVPNLELGALCVTCGDEAPIGAWRQPSWRRAEGRAAHAAQRLEAPACPRDAGCSRMCGGVPGRCPRMPAQRGGATGHWVCLLCGVKCAAATNKCARPHL
jgi:hypothetical protein